MVNISTSCLGVECSACPLNQPLMSSTKSLTNIKAFASNLFDGLTIFGREVVIYFQLHGQMPFVKFQLCYYESDCTVLLFF